MNVGGTFGIEDVVDLSERELELIARTELGVRALFRLVMEAEDDRPVVVADSTGEVLHLAIDLAAWLSVCDLAPGDNRAVFSLWLDRNHKVAATVTGPTVKRLILANAVIPVGVRTHHRELSVDASLEEFDRFLIALAVDRLSVRSQDDTVALRVSSR